MGRREKDDEESEPRKSYEDAPDPGSGVSQHQSNALSASQEKRQNLVLDDEGSMIGQHARTDAGREVPIAVVEQRVSNLAQGSMCLVLLTGPFLHVLNLIPRGVLAGLL